MSAATAESIAFGAQRLRCAQLAAHCGTLGNGSGAIHTLPPSYGTMLSASPWKAIIGTGVSSLHHFHGRICAAATAPMAAMRLESVHDSTNAMPPPFESPSA